MSEESWICPNCGDKNASTQMNSCWECDWPMNPDEKETWTCSKCNRLFYNTPSLAYNLPGITPGPRQYCFDCEPPLTAEEVIQQFEFFIDPPREEPK